MRIERNASAKINLTLEVLGRRSDGYHEIASVMHTLSLCDTLVMELPNAPVLDAARGEIVIEDPHPPSPLSHGVGEGGLGSPSAASWARGQGGEGVPTDSRNLIWKAVEAFVNSCPHPQPLSHGVGEGGIGSPSAASWARGQGGEGCSWKATLIKRIPTQAGLGGGSSDAATALLCLAEWARRWDIHPPDLHTLAAQLGADVAFFLNGACAFACGKGEILRSLPTLPQFRWVIAKPYGVGVPTAWAYQQLQRGALPPSPRAPYTERLVNALQQGAIKTPANLVPLLHNDFDEPILNAIPELQTLRQQMEQAGALKVILCGSGAAQAALCENQQQAERVANALLQQGYWAIAATTP